MFSTKILTCLTAIALVLLTTAAAITTPDVRIVTIIGVTATLYTFTLCLFAPNDHPLCRHDHPASNGFS